MARGHRAARRSLNKKESQLYAPLANIGSVLMDADAMYIDIGRANYTPKDRLQGREGGDGDGSDDDSQEEGDKNDAVRRSLGRFFFCDARPTWLRRLPFFFCWSVMTMTCPVSDGRNPSNIKYSFIQLYEVHFFFFSRRLHVFVPASAARLIGSAFEQIHVPINR